MLHRIIKWFVSETRETEEEQNYVEYDPQMVSKYRKLYPDIQMDEIRVPDFGGQKEFKITKWLKKDGDNIAKGEVLCQLETALFTMDLESFLDGYLYFRQRPGKWLYTDDFICLLLSKPPKADAR